MVEKYGGRQKFDKTLYMWNFKFYSGILTTSSSTTQQSLFLSLADGPDLFQGYFLFLPHYWAVWGGKSDSPPNWPTHVYKILGVSNQNRWKSDYD